MGAITDWLGGLSGPLVYAVVGALVFCEDALFVGFVLPGETAVVLGGVLAARGTVSVGWLAAVVVFAAIAGDSVGYEIGHRFGPRILTIRPLRKHQEQIGKAQELIRRRGPAAVFLGRFIAFFRAMMPALAGISHMPYRRFLLFNALGGLAWGLGFTLLGYFAGNAYARVEAQVGQVVAIVIAVLVLAALITWHIRRRRRRAAAEDTASAEGGGGGSALSGAAGAGSAERAGADTGAENTGVDAGSTMSGAAADAGSAEGEGGGANDDAGAGTGEGGGGGAGSGEGVGMGEGAEPGGSDTDPGRGD